MILDPMSILTGGMHTFNNSMINGWMTVTQITVTPPPTPEPTPVRRSGGSDGYGYDLDYSPMVVEPFIPKVIHSVEDIAEMIQGMEGDEINITLEYKPRNRKNILVECQFIEKRITAQLATLSSKTVKVNMIYTDSDQ